MFKVWVNCHRYMLKRDPKVFRILNRWRHAKAIDPRSVEALGELLGIDQKHAYDILKSFKIVTTVTKDQIVATHSICLENGIDNETLKQYPDLLRFQPNALEQRIRLYKDIGCPKVEPPMILPYMVALKVTPNDLKKQNLLPPDADVVRNLLSCLHEPPPDVTPVERPSDDEKLETIHKSLLKHYLRWKLELTEDQLNRMMNTQWRFGYPSFTLLRETMDILLDELQFAKAKIMSNGYVLSKSPRYIRLLMEEIPKIANEDMKSIIHRFPRILHLRMEVLREKLNTLRARNVPDDAIVRVPFILTLASKTLDKRLQEFKAMSDLAVHWKHPRMLMIIFYFEGVKRNLQKLQELDIRFTSIHVLCASKKAFEKYIQIGSERTKCKDTLRFLADELQTDRDTIRTALKRNPLWCQIPFIFVHETYGFLKEKNFSNEAIFNNLPLLLHRSAQVERYLKNMDLKRLDEPWELTDSRKLALCSYDIEKQYHFNGSGVWNCQHDEALLTRYERSQARRKKSKRKILDL